MYKDIVINYNILLSTPYKIILKSILLTVVIIENNSSKWKDFKANLEKNNNKNNLYHTIKAVSINELRILSSYIYTNVKKSRQNLYLKFISPIPNFSDKNIIEDHNNNSRLVISYNLYSNRKSLFD